MRILQVSPYFYPYIGGQERYVRNLGRALVDRGHTVEILTSNFPKSEKCETIEGMQVKRFNFLCNPLNNPLSPTLLFHLIRRCRDFDIIHCHNEHAIVSQYCALARSYLKFPLIVSCHGQLRFDNAAKNLIESAYSSTLGLRLLRKADKIITMSDSDREYVHSLGTPIEKIRLIPNGVDLARYNFQKKNPRKRALFEGNRIVLFVGPLLRRKGPHVLVEAIPLIIEEHPDVVFVFVGEGDYKEEVKKLSRKLHVTNYTYFTGKIPEDQLHYLYHRSHIFVLPSFSEGLPYTILDALAFSKPIVSTLIPGIMDHLNGSTLLVPPGESKALACAVIRILSDEKLARELGTRGRHLIETRFSWDVIIEKVLDVYHEVLNSPLI